VGGQRHAQAALPGTLEYEANHNMSAKTSAFIPRPEEMERRSIHDESLQNVFVVQES
jgi:hypothetical protein